MELMRALGAFAEPPAPGHAELARLLGFGRPPERTEHTSLFVLALPPYASMYLGEEGMLGGSARDRVRGFWGALGQAPPAEPDHAAALLGLYAELVEREESLDASGARVLGNARKALFWEHLACWLVPYLSRAEDLAEGPYRAWVELLRDALAQEASALGAPSVPPLHFREAPPALGAEMDTLDEMIGALLAPVRSGVILARGDLARMAAALGGGARVGDRRSLLRGLLAQGPAEALAWLAFECERQAALLDLWPAELAPVRDFWEGRAQATAARLEAWGAEAARS